MNCGPVSRPSSLSCGNGSSIEANTPDACETNCNTTCGGAIAVPCPENHCEVYQTNKFSTVIKVQNTWNVPECGEEAILSVPDTLMALPGSYIWNETYGYFEILSYNASTREITVQNNCNEGNADPGTQVIQCSNFIVAPPPNSAVFPNFFPYVSADFVAPADGACIDITVTTTNGLIAGATIQIGSGEYTIDAISSSTNITICNEGAGITPGTPVYAQNDAGELQYPISILSNGCCSATLTERVSSTREQVIVDAATPEVEGTIALMSVTPAAGSDDLKCLYITESYLEEGGVAMAGGANQASTMIQIVTQVRINGGAWVDVRTLRRIFNTYDTDGGTTRWADNINHPNIIDAPAGMTTTIEARTVIADFFESNVGGNYDTFVTTEITLIGSVG